MVELKFKGYVLLESMIAMILVMLCFGFSIMIYNQLVTGSRSKLKIKARINMCNEASKSKSERRFLDERIDCGEFQIEKQILEVKDAPSCIQLHYVARSTDGFQLGEYNEIIEQP